MTFLWKMFIRDFQAKWTQNDVFLVFYKIDPQNFSDFLHKVLLTLRLKIDPNDVF